MSRPLILLAEDDTASAFILMEALEHEGYTVVHARNGKHALALLDSVRPAVVVTDLMMPGMDGLALLKELARRPGPRPAVLAVSPFETYLASALELGADGVLAEPFQLDDFLRQVHAVAIGSASRATRMVPLDERLRLRAIVEMQLDQPSPTEALGEFTERVAQIFDVPICLVSIVTADRASTGTRTAGCPPTSARSAGPRATTPSAPTPSRRTPRWW